MNTIGETIATLRKKQGLTQEALANLIGVSAQSVSKWENNTNMPDISLLPLLADIFSCRIDDLFNRGVQGIGEIPEIVCFIIVVKLFRRKFSMHSSRKLVERK
ncbi:MAG: helix-turn-helix domain-containing protein [Lachnospiraceae bacterium]|nr:helix-turn-helix domain-containing protein [Lachnospiraceae bacterium]